MRWEEHLVAAQSAIVREEPKRWGWKVGETERICIIVSLSFFFLSSKVSFLGSPTHHNVTLHRALLSWVLMKRSANSVVSGQTPFNSRIATQFSGSARSKSFFDLATTTMQMTRNSPVSNVRPKKPRLSVLSQSKHGSVEELGINHESFTL